MKYQGKITDPKDLVTKEYVDTGLSGKQNTLTFDDAPTAGSSNPVKSSGIKSALDAKADQTDLASIHATGSTNTTGAKIKGGTYFYLNGALVQAKADIATNATFTSGTNYVTVTAGALNDLTTYNEAETIVGTWIDGKPIYRQVISNVTIASTAGQQIIGSLGTAITMVVSARFILFDGNSYFSENLIYSGSRPDTLTIGFLSKTGNIAIKNYVTSYFGGKVTAIIEYIK